MGSGWRAEMRWRFSIKALVQIPREQSIEGGRKIIRRDLRQRCLADNKRREPTGCRPRQRFVGQIRPFIAFRPSQKVRAAAKLQLRLAPRKPADPKPRNAL